MKKIFGFVVGIVAIAALTCGQFTDVAGAAFIDPSVTSYPFETWDRGDADSTYAEWGVGNSAATGFSDNSAAAGVQDIDSPNFHFNAASADVIENSGGSFLTSGFNIYSFSVATDFDVTMPSYGYGAFWDTRFVAQIRTQGTELDLSTVKLSWDDGGQLVSPDSTTELYRESLGGFGGNLVDTMFVWDIEDFNPLSFLLEFKAAGSSMSLDMLAVDTYTVPEPASVALLGVAACMAAAGVRRRVR